MRTVPDGRSLSFFVLLVAVSAGSGADTACTVTQYSAVANAVSQCKDIVLSGISVPGGKSLNLSQLQDGSSVRFTGRTTFGFADADYDMIKIGGSDITINAQKGAVIDGNGGAWWDGLGSNGGTVQKPNRFISVNAVTGKSVIADLHVQNWPVRAFAINGCDGLTIRNIVLDNSAGDAPNSKSSGKPAAHNTDGFDISSSTDIILYNNHVTNQDDCVAVTSGNGMIISNMTCVGGHGLSIGSIGGKTDNTVQNVHFANSTVINSQNGVRIKTNAGTTGIVKGITYESIILSGITDYGIDIQQDYLNGGATGKPTNGVKISSVTMNKVTGTVKDGTNYRILCGSGSCSDFTFNNIDIEGGSGDSCNYSPGGKFVCK